MAEEPVKPKGRGRKLQPAAASLFEWALSRGTGAGGGVGRRGALGRNTQGGGRRYLSAMASPCATDVCGPSCVSAGLARIRAVPEGVN